jgi:hypothetical protein
MRRLLLTITASLLTLLAATSARAQMSSRSADVHRPYGRVYASIANYFAPDSPRDFRIVSVTRHRSKAEFVATHIVHDKVKWSAWTYCKVPATQLFDALQQGNVTVRVKVERDGADHTYVTVSAEFQGVYQFAGNSSTTQCTSQGTLEKDILSAAGASPSDLY